MGYGDDQPMLWPCPPDWGSAVRETLAWLTDVMLAVDGAQQARGLRAAPRRSFSFRCVAQGDAHRVLNAIRFDAGVKQLVLPIYPDIQQLDAALDAGSLSIPCRTDGFDFVVGGQALLWRDTNVWELVQVTAIASDALTIDTPGTASAWDAGTRLYPVRVARLQDTPKANQLNDDASVVDVQLLIDEPCDWAGAWPSAATYRGVPVLEWRGNEESGPVDQFDRATGVADQDVGTVFYFDIPGMPFRVQSQQFTLFGRQAHSAFRALLYQLDGRPGQLWVPSWQADLRLVQAALSTATQLQVAWAGYTRFGYLQRNRRDIRIELYGGTVIYRRVTGSAENSSGELLQLDAALGVDVDPVQVRQINWLSLCAMASDTVQLDHVTDADGVGQSTINWQAIKTDV